MKKFILFCAFCFSTAIAFASVSSDSVAYSLERKKVNAMLAARATKFGQYDESLKKHTGIFGIQTKKDIRRSNDILMDIVKTDDDIYKELKVLLEYSVFQRAQVQTHTTAAENSNLGFMNTINKLRQQNEQLKAEAATQEQEFQKRQNIFIIALIVMFGLILLLLRRRTPKKRKR